MFQVNFISEPMVLCIARMVHTTVQYLSFQNSNGRSELFNMISIWICTCWPNFTFFRFFYYLLHLNPSIFESLIPPKPARKIDYRIRIWIHFTWSNSKFEFRSRPLDLFLKGPGIPLRTGFWSDGRHLKLKFELLQLIQTPQKSQVVV